MSQFKTPSRPSRAWLQAVFDSSPRRDVESECKSTTRYPNLSSGSAQELHAEGWYEDRALLLLEEFKREGYVKRYKPQAFLLEEIGGPPKRVPDFLVELWDGRVIVIQVKTERFLSDLVKAKLETERLFLLDHGFEFLCWTDKNVLTNSLYKNLLQLDREWRNPMDSNLLSRLQQFASGSKTLGDLLGPYNWEEVISAIATQKLFVSHLESYDEKTPYSLTCSTAEPDLLFRTGTTIYPSRRELRPARSEKWGAAAQK